jgi:hypothetical protein
MSPPTERARPTGEQGGPRDWLSTQIVTPTADGARAALDFEVGFRLGYGHGYDIGYAHGVADEGDAWQAILTGHAEVWRRPNYSELQARRATLRRCRCDRCSACVRWAAIRANRARYGCDDFPGVAA